MIKFLIFALVTIVAGVWGTIYLVSRLKTKAPIISEKDRAYTEWCKDVMEYISTYGEFKPYPKDACTDKEAFEMGILPSEYAQLVIIKYH